MLYYTKSSKTVRSSLMCHSTSSLNRASSKVGRALNGNLYALESSTILGSANIFTNTMSNNDTKLWHLRLGHMEKEVYLNFLNKAYLIVKSSETLGFANNVFMGNTRGLVSNPPKTTLREF